MTRAWGRPVFLWPALLGAVASFAPGAAGQWTNRYPKVEGYGHHVYVEGYDLPMLTNGPIDVAPAPDGERIAFSARGWIWIMDLETGVATRLTSGGELDFRPAWSPDATSIAFVRDNDHETWIVVIDVATGEERARIDSPAIELDPTFSSNGDEVFYSSGEAGSIDLWAYALASGEKTRLTTTPGLEVRAQASSQGLLYVAKGGGDRVLWTPFRRPPTTAAAAASPSASRFRAPRPLITGSIVSVARPALSPDGRSVALNWPTQDGWELRIMSRTAPGPHVILVADALPLMPAWGAHGEWVYYSEADADERMELKRVRAVGGPPEIVSVRRWEWGEATGTIRIRTTIDGAAVPTRLEVSDRDGHPAIPDTSPPRFDGQSGRVFFYSAGEIELEAPPGPVRVAAVQGLATPEASAAVEVRAGETVEVEIELEPLWDARAEGWTSGEHHFHLNYGGIYDLSPDDLVPMMRGEALDVATPLLANLHNRFEDQDLWGWRSAEGGPLIRFGQEVRSHFLGHVALIGIEHLFWPWVWGPRYEVYGSDDRENAEALRHARAADGIGFYVHPVSIQDPFSDGGASSVPIELVADAVLGDLDALEVVCLWSDEIGTAEVWYRFLDLGLPVAASAGTDVMTDYYRTMAVGTTRVYARTGGATDWPTYADALRRGRSFVTNGPLIDFRLEHGADGGTSGPGDAVTSGPGDVVTSGPVRWSLDLRTASSVERVEVVVNGEVVWSGEGPAAPGRTSYEGELELPAGGWVAARAVGGETVWPSMDSYPFAHTGPMWIGEVGSTEPGARARAASELFALLGVARERLVVGYGDAEIPALLARFDAARDRLLELIEP